MKYLLALILFPFCAFSQEKIQGLGKFKIGKTSPSIIDSLIVYESMNKDNLYTLRDQLSKKERSLFIGELFPDSTSEWNSPLQSHYCVDVRVFYIPNYKIADIWLKGLYLTFYKGLLTSIDVEYSRELLDALELKYGAPKISAKEKKVECTLETSGVKVSLPENIYYSEWNNGSISAIAAIGNYRDSKCEKKHISYISLSDGKDDIIRSCDNKLKALIKSKIDSEKKKKLDDL